MNERSERLTYDEVTNACSLLKEVNLEPTQTRVHSLLQRGSNTTIARHIKQWQSSTTNQPVKLSSSLVRAIEAEIERHSAIATATLSDNLRAEKKTK